MTTPAQTDPTVCWLIASLRSTLFPSQQLPGTPSDWWREVTQVDPDEIRHNPRPQLTVIEGDFAGARLRLTHHPQRIDWLLSPSPQWDVETRGYPTICPWEGEDFDKLVRPIRAWFLAPANSRCRRLAFGADLSEPVPDRPAGYRLLGSLLKTSVHIDADDSSDFSYQINRPRRSTVVPDLTLNRLSKWSVTLLQEATMPIAPQPMPPTVKTVTAAQLTLDINTDGYRVDPLPADALPSLMDELVSLAREISEKGDLK